MKNLKQDTKDLIGISLSPYQLSLLEEYEQELDKWNERYSLTAIHEPEKIRVKHFLDSFSPMLVMKNTLLRRLLISAQGQDFLASP